MVLHAAEQSEPDIEEVIAFLRVAESGSFTAAAQRLRVPKSTVSRRVTRLETKLGAQLLHRTTRNLALTEVGVEFQARAGRALAGLEEATSAVRDGLGTVRGHLRVTAPYDLATGPLATVIGVFSRTYPQVTVELLLSDHTIDLVAEGIDIALRGAVALPDSSLVARKLASQSLMLAASPAYAAKHGLPSTPADLHRHELAVMRGNHGQAKLQLHHTDGTIEDLHVRAAVSVNGFGFLRAAAVAGSYIATLPDMHANPEIHSGRLVRVLPEYTAGVGNVFLVHPATKVIPAKVRAFRDFMLANLDVLRLGPECAAATAKHRSQ